MVVVNFERSRILYKSHGARCSASEGAEGVDVIAELLVITFENLWQSGNILDNWKRQI